LWTAERKKRRSSTRTSEFFRRAIVYGMHTNLHLGIRAVDDEIKHDIA